MVKDWLANAYGGVSRREFLAQVGVTGIGLAGFHIAATPVAGKVITTSLDGIAVTEGTVPSGDFLIPIYEARPVTAGKYPVVLVIPEVFGMHEHIKDVTRRFAAYSREVKAAVAWYGQIRPVITKGVRMVGPLNVAARIKAPILGLYGGEDLGIPVADVRAMEAALKAAGKTAEFIIYPGAPHAFFADYRPSYRADAAKDAWSRCIAWFKGNLEE
ncbi:MAG: dienelactone hydrolase family protein [Deltaproteobacteria bacterium]|nr:dienelactone hydrolase family protein [Deltaproteobacteria bacterium]